MPNTYRYDAGPDLVRVQSTGDVTASEVRADYEALATEPWMRPGLRFLADHRGARTLPPSSKVETAAFATARAATYVGGAGIAVIVPDTVQYGVIRQFDAYSEMSGAEARPFYGEDEALAWLRVGSP